MTTLEKTAAHYAKARENQLRNCLRKDFGARHYRIVGVCQATEIHAYGRMPNSIETGWYLLGGIRDVEARYCI